MEDHTIEVIAKEGKGTLEMLLEKSSDTQAIACFLLCIILIVAIVLIVRSCSKMVHYVSEKNALSLNKLADEISKNRDLNNSVMLELKDTKQDLIEKLNKTKSDIIKENK